MLSLIIGISYIFAKIRILSCVLNRVLASVQFLKTSTFFILTVINKLFFSSRLQNFFGMYSALISSLFLRKKNGANSEELKKRIKAN